MKVRIPRFLCVILRDLGCKEVEHCYWYVPVSREDEVNRLVERLRGEGYVVDSNY